MHAAQVLDQVADLPARQVGTAASSPAAVAASANSSPPRGGGEVLSRIHAVAPATPTHGAGGARPVGSAVPGDDAMGWMRITSRLSARSAAADR